MSLNDAILKFGKGGLLQGLAGTSARKPSEFFAPQEFDIVSKIIDTVLLVILNHVNQ